MAYSSFSAVAHACTFIHSLLKLDTFAFISLQFCTAFLQTEISAYKICAATLGFLTAEREKKIK